MGSALAKLGEEDPTFRVRTDQETGQTIIAGMGELHLEVIVDRMLREFKVDANVGKPQVAYRETITRHAKAEGRFVRQTGGKGQFGDVWLEVEPLPPGGGFEFVNKIVGGTIPREYIPAVEAGVREAMETGVLAGYPDGGRAGRSRGWHLPRGRLLRDGLQDCWLHGSEERREQGSPNSSGADDEGRGGVPEEFLGDVMGDVSARRGHILGAEVRGNIQVVRAEVPLAEMFGYATDLRSMTQGRATYSMEFSHYSPVPASVSEEVASRSYY